MSPAPRELHSVVHRARRLAQQGLPIAKLGTRRLAGRKSPFQMTLSLTNRCNFHCVYCDIPTQRREEMGLDEWKACIDDLRAAGMGRASLIGGEPLIHKHVGDIISHLGARGVHTAMNTNGWLVPDRIEDMAKLDLVCVSLDGDRELTDRQRRPGAYDKVIAALEALHSRGVPVVTMTVVTADASESAEHVLEIARSFGHKAFFQLEHAASCDVNAPIAPAVSDARVKALVDRLLQLKADGWPVGNSSAVLREQGERRYLGTCEDCYAGKYYGYVFSDGTVAPCLLTQRQQETGNGRSLGFARAFHEMPAPVGPGCSCVPTHEVNRVLALQPRALWHAVNLTLGVPASA
ncbi:MAG: radical SAM protein [Myxococcales bacterium]|nr:radical SAM protein [Myxococcales bacterium]MCB9521384.1 radical SAM protein [Myxococcales bacterium]MCB9533795.1 radical SAM protein [Myxococcales bacterium]